MGLPRVPGETRSTISALMISACDAANKTPETSVPERLIPDLNHSPRHGGGAREREREWGIKRYKGRKVIDVGDREREGMPPH